MSVSVTSKLLRSVRTLLSMAMYAVGDLKRITKSSRYSRADYRLTANNMTPIVRWKVPGALRIAKGMRMKQYNPR